MEYVLLTIYIIVATYYFVGTIYSFQEVRKHDETIQLFLTKCYSARIFVAMCIFIIAYLWPVLVPLKPFVYRWIKSKLNPPVYHVRRFESNVAIW